MSLLDAKMPSLRDKHYGQMFEAEVKEVKVKRTKPEKTPAKKPVSKKKK